MVNDKIKMGTLCRSKEQLSVYRGEIVDVLEKRPDSALVRNTLGEQGLVPAVCLSADKQPSRKQSPTAPRKDSQPQPSSRRGSAYGIGDIPNFDPTPIPHNIPPPPPNIPPNWPHSSPVARVASPNDKPQRKSDHYLAFQDAGIIGELSKRKPLRTTPNNPKSSPSKQQDDVQSGIALKFQKEPPIAKKPRIKPITLDSTKEEVLRWLQHFSYLIAAEMLRGMNGRDLVTVPKEELRNICGFGEGTRLYTHLQKQEKRHQLETVPERSPGDAAEAGGFAKFLKEHRDKVSGVSAVEEGPSVWQQMQASKAEAEKAERRRQKEEIWGKRRRTRELEEQADSLEPEASLEPEHKTKNVRKADKKQQKHRSPSDSEDRDTKGRSGRGKHTKKAYHKRHVSRESSESADSDSSSVTSSQYDSESSYTSSEDSDAVKEAKDKKKEPVPAPSVPSPTQYPQQPTGMYTTLPPGIMPPGYPPVGYLPTAPMGIQYQDLIAQQMLRQQQVAQAEQEAWNADMRLKQLRTQQSMGLPPSPTGMYGSYVSPIIGSNPSYGYHTFERNYTSII